MNFNNHLVKEAGSFPHIKRKKKERNSIMLSAQIKNILNHHLVSGLFRSTKLYLMLRLDS